MVESYLTARLQVPSDSTDFGLYWSVTHGDSVGGGAVRSPPGVPPGKGLVCTLLHLPLPGNFFGCHVPTYLPRNTRPT